MAFSKYLDVQTMHKLVEGIQKSSPPAELGNVRFELLSGIDLGYVASLSPGGTPKNQILSDLNTMNTVPYLLGDEVPLEIWLYNAIQRLRSIRRPETPFFEQVHEDVTVKSQRLIAEAKGETADPSVLDGEERLVHKDDMLSYGWLLGAINVGRSVARLKVARFDSEIPANLRYFGTGWLIGKQHIITNHHVINARSKGEPSASIADLHLQAQSTQVEFDYNDANVSGTRVEVEELCIWGAKDANPSLDYAILKLKTPITDRERLILAPQNLKSISQALQSNQNDKPPVNIIQHPGGKPKMLGIRNNQVYQLTPNELSYFTDTEGGSSGSPVCNDEWQVVALHKKWKRFIQQNVMFQGKQTAWENRGTRIDRIIEDIQEKKPALWTEIDAHVII